MTVAEHGEEGVNVSALLASLEAGSYTIEASTFRAERTGAFDFEIEFPRQAAARDCAGMHRLWVGVMLEAGWLSISVSAWIVRFGNGAGAIMEKRLLVGTGSGCRFPVLSTRCFAVLRMRSGEPRSPSQARSTAFIAWRRYILRPRHVRIAGGLRPVDLSAE